MTSMERNRIEIESLLEILNTMPLGGFKLRGIIEPGEVNIPEPTVKSMFGFYNYAQLLEMKPNVKLFDSGTYVYYYYNKNTRLYCVGEI